MIDDIAALQHLYGVNEQYKTGDDVYTITSFGTVSARAANGDVWRVTLLMPLYGMPVARIQFPGQARAL